MGIFNPFDFDNIYQKLELLVVFSIGILQIYVTWKIAKRLDGDSHYSQKIDYIRHMLQQWQDFNKLTITESGFAKIAADLEGRTDLKEYQYEHVVCYKLNILYDCYVLSKNKALLSELAQSSMTDHFKILARPKSRTLCLKLLETARGYDPDFIRFAKTCLEA